MGAVMLWSLTLVQHFIILISVYDKKTSIHYHFHLNFKCKAFTEIIRKKKEHNGAFNRKLTRGKCYHYHDRQEGQTSKSSDAHLHGCCVRSPRDSLQTLICGSEVSYWILRNNLQVLLPKKRKWNETERMNSKNIMSVYPGEGSDALDPSADTHVPSLRFGN